MKKAVLSAVTLSLLGVFLGGCGGGSSTTATTEGTVIDGYLQNAKVCIDKNSNGKCDENEPYAFTDSNGKYVINADAGNYPVVAEIIADKTKDVTYNYTWSTNATLISIPGKPQVISPVTTLGYGLIKTGEALSDVENTIKEIFGVSDLMENYISSNNTAIAAKAFVIANILSSCEPDEIKYVAETIATNSTVLDQINSTVSSVTSMDDITSVTDSSDLDTILSAVNATVAEAKEKEAEVTVDNIWNYKTADLDNLRAIISVGDVKVFTPDGISECTINGTDYGDYIDMTITCPSFTIYATDTPVLSTDKLFVGKVTNSTESSLIGKYVVVSTVYYGNIVDSALDGTFQNYHPSSSGWTEGSSTYLFNSIENTISVNNGDESYSGSYTKDDNGTLSGTVTGSATINFKIYPILKDENGNVLIYLDVDGSAEEPQLLIKQ
ncbi:hypothetical protein [Desulfurobacterium sp.]